MEFGEYPEVIECQMQAVTRTLLLKVLKNTSLLTFNEVTRALAEAEREASFFCGFTDLEAATEYKEALCKHMVDLGIVVADELGRLTLTEAGMTYAKVMLPLNIERCL